jgi:hypothetical protein
MNIPKIEEAITLLYQTYIEDQKVATHRGIAITAMNEMIKSLGGDDVVKKIEAVPYSARLRTQHLFEDEPQRTWVGLTRTELIRCGVLPFGLSYELYEAIEAKLKEKNGYA